MIHHGQEKGLKGEARHDGGDQWDLVVFVSGIAGKLFLVIVVLD